MGFSDAVRSVVVERYADFQGRSPRSELWWFALFSMLISLAVAAVAAVSDTLGGILNLVVSIALLVPAVAVQVRRLHDLDRTGWWVLIGLVPLVGTVVLLVFYLQRGTEGENRFGPDPLAEVGDRFA